MVAFEAAMLMASLAERFYSLSSSGRLKTCRFYLSLVLCNPQRSSGIVNKCDICWVGGGWLLGRLTMR